MVLVWRVALRQDIDVFGRGAEDGHAELLRHVPEQARLEKGRSVEHDDRAARRQARDKVVCHSVRLVDRI